jgi:hypothetical protein
LRNRFAFLEVYYIFASVRAVKFIRTFILLLAGMLLVSHTIIPHDHHLIVSSIGFNDKCPFTGERSDHHPLFPVHCHAFNDVAAEIIFAVSIKQLPQTSFVSDVWRPVDIIPGLIPFHNIVENSGKPFPDIPLTDFSPFRGPPSVS